MMSKLQKNNKKHLHKKKQLKQKRQQHLKQQQKNNQQKLKLLRQKLPQMEQLLRAQRFSRAPGGCDLGFIKANCNPPIFNGDFA